MQVKVWETTIQEIASESNREQTEAGRNRVLTAWRARLEKPPTQLQSFQIDEIVREVRKRLVISKVVAVPKFSAASDPQCQATL